MNIRNGLSRKLAIFIGIFCLGMAWFAHAQPRPASQQEVEALIKKMPTREQQNELTEIMDSFNKKSEAMGDDMERYVSHLEKIVDSPGIPLSSKDIEECISIHKRTKELVLNAVDEFSTWGSRSSRASCVRQAAAQKAFFERGSAHFMANIKGLPLSTAGERAASILWINLQAGNGGELSLVPDDVDPRPRYLTGILRLYSTCLGGAEYVPGAE